MNDQEESPFSKEVLHDLVSRQIEDQAASSKNEMATLFSTYFKALLGEGLPVELAEEMLLDYHWLFTASCFFKHGVFPSRRGC
jgi:hypothetical protein